jgi:hypothetical protein
LLWSDPLDELEVVTVERETQDRTYPLVDVAADEGGLEIRPIDRLQPLIAPHRWTVLMTHRDPSCPKADLRWPRPIRQVWRA